MIDFALILYNMYQPSIKKKKTEIYLQNDHHYHFVLLLFYNMCDNEVIFGWMANNFFVLNIFFGSYFSGIGGQFTGLTIEPNPVV